MLVERFEKQKSMLLYVRVLSHPDIVPYKKEASYPYILQCGSKNKSSTPINLIRTQQLQI